MAKKDKKAAKDKTAKPGRIPKSIGGVKLSKGLRQSGELLIEKAQTPQGRQMIAAGLAMASAAVARATMSPVPPVPPVPPVAPVPPAVAQSGEGAPPPAPPPAPPVNAAPDGMGTPTVDPAQIAEAVGQAATAFFDGLFGRKR